MNINDTIATPHHDTWSHPSAGETSTRKKTIAGLVGGAVIATGAVLASATAQGVLPSAHADVANDADFVLVARQGGINAALDRLIANGHTVCYNIDMLGMSPAQVQHQVWLQTDLDTRHSIWFTIDAILHYCPWDKNLMPGQTDATQQTSTVI
jgi:hypothetical protein